LKVAAYIFSFYFLHSDILPGTVTKNSLNVRLEILHSQLNQILSIPYQCLVHSASTLLKMRAKIYDSNPHKPWQIFFLFLQNKNPPKTSSNFSITNFTFSRVYFILTSESWNLTFITTAMTATERNTVKWSYE
jgi:hypothetical protein